MPSSDSSDYLNITFENDDGTLDLKSNRILPFANSPVYNTTIINAKQLSKGEDVKVVYDIALDLQNIEYEFEPGDTIGILPCNDENEVEQILLRLNVSTVATKTYNLCIAKETTKKKPIIPAHIPACGTLQELFLKNLDIRSPPKKLFLKLLARYTTQQEDTDKLRHLCSPKSSQEYNEFITKNRTLLSLLKLFPSCQPPIERLLEYLPPLQPRPYSISSSPLLETPQKELHVTFAVIDVEENAKGVCTGWLESSIKKHFKSKAQKGINTVNKIARELQKLNIDSNHEMIHIPFYFRKFNNFRLPADPAIPIIMIGPGTGVAPFIGFLQHRHLETKKSNVTFGASWLVYGCRYSDRDFLYKSEIEELQKNGTLTKLFVCCSRESSPKTYVQDLIKDNAKCFINKIVHENAVTYVCGDAKNMAKDIRQTIVSCLMDCEDWSATESESYIKHLQQSNRYIQDIWI